MCDSVVPTVHTQLLTALPPVSPLFLLTTPPHTHMHTTHTRTYICTCTCTLHIYIRTHALHTAHMHIYTHTHTHSCIAGLHGPVQPSVHLSPLWDHLQDLAKLSVLMYDIKVTMATTILPCTCMHIMQRYRSVSHTIVPIHYIGG